MPTFTINKATGEFVGARRSARLAAKRGAAVFTPRVERYSEGVAAPAPAAAPPTAWMRISGKPRTPAPAPVAAPATGRRTSARLAPLYAKKAAVEKARAEALALVDEVLAYADERAGQLGIGDYSDVRMKRDTPPAGFTMYYDPFTDTRACCACGGGACETEMKAELDATLLRFHADILPCIKRADGTAASVEAVMVATYNHPDLPVILRAAKVKASCKRFYDTLEKKMLEYLAHPQTTLTLQLVCGAILHQYYGM
jgi:hypothetical protein